MRALGVVGGLVLAAALLALGIHNLGNHYFWTDESSALMIALGWPAPGHPWGGLQDMTVHMSAYLDPGLFHFATRAWAELFGTSIVTLRLLPFLFFIAYVAGLLLWFRLVRAPWIVATAGAALLMLENITPYYSVEVRPYTASMAAAVLLPFLAVWVIDRPTTWRLIGYLAVFSFLTPMQYNSASVDIAVGALLLAGVFAHRERGARIRLLLGSAWSFALLPTIFLLTRGNPFADKSETLTYISATLFRFQTSEQLLHTLQVNLLSWTALPRTVFVVLVPVLWFSGRLARPTNRTAPREALIGWIWVYVVAAMAGAAVLSAAGVLPWIVGTRWSITDIGYIGLSVAGLIGLLLLTTVPRRAALAWAMVVASILLTFAGSYRLSTYQRPNDVSYMAALTPALLSGAPGGLVVDYWIFPETRYWVEYSGELDQYRDAWIAHGVSSTDGCHPAGAAEIESFLGSSYDRLLLRSQRALDESGVVLDGSVTITSIPADQLPAGFDPLDAPIVLSKL